jgi:hypothetical protein
MFFTEKTRNQDISSHISFPPSPAKDRILIAFFIFQWHELLSGKTPLQHSSQNCDFADTSCQHNTELMKPLHFIITRTHKHRTQLCMWGHEDESYQQQALTLFPDGSHSHRYEAKRVHYATFSAVPHLSSAANYLRVRCGRIHRDPVYMHAWFYACIRVCRRVLAPACDIFKAAADSTHEKVTEMFTEATV